MAILMIISGFFMTAALQFWNNQQTVKRYRSTVERMELTQEVVNEYFVRFGRYPCPADPRLSPGDAGYGEAACRPDNSAPCAAGWPPNGPKCVSMGARDADDDGASDRVLIGALPFATLSSGATGLTTPFAVAEGFDAYGNVLSYAVTENMTDQSYTYSRPVKPRLGAIEVRDANNRSVVTPEGIAHYVIFSHGPTAEGAYTREGNRIGNCFVPGITSVPPGGFNPGTPGMQVELENCDNNDAIFVKELRSFADTDEFNDDILFYGVNMQDQIWRNSTFAPVGDQYYYNTNLGYIGVGTINPGAPLHIAGATATMRVETASNADLGFCDLAGPPDIAAGDSPTQGDCLDPAFLAGDLEEGTGGFACESGHVATGIEENELVCVPLLDTSPGATINWVSPPGSSCPPGEVVKAIEVRANNSMELFCEPEPTAPAP